MSLHDQSRCCVAAPQTDPIDFSITAPESALEFIVSHAVGGLGAVHQYVTMKAFLLWAQRQQTTGLPSGEPELTPEILLAGVIYNDFPWGDELGAGVDYQKHILARFQSSQTASYVTDQRFRWQPHRDIQWASAALYKNLPDAFTRIVAQVSQETVDEARVMLQQRTDATRVVYHFLRKDREETDAEVQRRAIEKAKEWFAAALERRSLFPLGHIWHMIEDSFSPAHTQRNLLHGTVVRVYYFGDQTDRWHSSHESWDAVRVPGTEGYKRADAAKVLLAKSLDMFMQALGSSPQQRPAAVQQFGEWLATDVLRLEQTVSVA